MAFAVLYNKFRKKSNTKSLKEVGEDVFNGLVKESLEKLFRPLDKECDIIVSWASDNLTQSARAVSADYAIEFEVKGWDISGYGTATVNNNSVYNALMRFDRVQEVGEDHDYITSINAGGYSADKFVADITSKIEKVWNLATKEDK